jgi:hypothetical protein
MMRLSLKKLQYDIPVREAAKRASGGEGVEDGRDASL